MTTMELLKYAGSIGRGEDMDLITAIFAGLVTSKPGVVHFKAF